MGVGMKKTVIENLFQHQISAPGGDNFAIEPRFLSSRRLGYVGGVQIPPAGAYGLE